MSLLLRDDGGLGRLVAEFRNLERRSLSNAGFQIRRGAQA